ncbi:MAG: hypothetical protein V4488_12310 [Pseudomonadota bacterium]
MSKEETMKNGKTDIFTEYKDQQLWYRNPTGAAYPQPMNNQRDAAYLKLELSMHLLR